MKKEMAHELYQCLESSLTAPDFLDRIDLEQKTMLHMIRSASFCKDLEGFPLDNKFSCKMILDFCRKLLDKLSPEPDIGWLEFTFYVMEQKLFPESFERLETEGFKKGFYVLLECIRVFLDFERLFHEFDPTLYFRMPEESIWKASGSNEEYKRFLTFLKDYYIFEFMRLASEITPYNTLAHIAGVHHVAMHAANQLKELGVCVDLPMISAAAISHDIGKYGCRKNELNRVAYLHYYYTDRCMKRNGMQGIAHIAANHSTWDLELENLSVETLLLIYADFQVRSTRGDDGKEVSHFYNLDESFDIILNKLDHVDEKKKQRYIHVYAKLKDFENYMKALGVRVELAKSHAKPKLLKDPVLLNMDEIVERYKMLAFDHNIKVMNKLTNEISFGRIMEDAKSEDDWHRLRAYLQIFREYSTYLNQRQKLRTLDFLYNLLMHREGDIRYESAKLMGNLIINYDLKYRKEFPDDAILHKEEVSSLSLWRSYVGWILTPDHKVQDQHRVWLGSMFDAFLETVITECERENQEKYIKEFMAYAVLLPKDDPALFYAMNGFMKLPLLACAPELLSKIIGFALKHCEGKSLEFHVAALRFAEYFVSTVPSFRDYYDSLKQIFDAIPQNESVGISFLYFRLERKMGKNEHSQKRLSLFYPETISYIYLENLKTATPWICKITNIELLLEQIRLQGSAQALHTATHLTNLLTVSENRDVRHRAGEVILSVADLLTIDQRNEVAVEMEQGLELGEYEFAKHVPQYLGEMMLKLHPNELDEFVETLGGLIVKANDKIACVALDTLGFLVQKYDSYYDEFEEEKSDYEGRRDKILGLILRGLANYHDRVSQEAVYTIGSHVFGNSSLGLMEKARAFHFMCRKFIHIINDREEDTLSFYNNAACLNHLYRFITNYLLEKGAFPSPSYSRIAFFPGTFDPFTLSHKAIVREIRNQGFEVYLSLDEFSWSKKTQPRLIRRKITVMSIADEGHTYLFPDDIPVNIDNPADLKHLKQLFPEHELYIVVGSDVIENASAYKKPAVPFSIHEINHIVFLRNSSIEESMAEKVLNENGVVKGRVLKLKLPPHMEDISSTRIRENIDYNREISMLVDPAAQNYIYEESLYLREPKYKPILISKDIICEPVQNVSLETIEELCFAVLRNKRHKEEIKQLFERYETHAILLREGSKSNQPIAFSIYRHIPLGAFMDEFRDVKLANRLRQLAAGKTLLLQGLYVSPTVDIPSLRQLLLTETLAKCLQEEYTYAIYHGKPELEECPDKIEELLLLQGFKHYSAKPDEKKIMIVDMKYPSTVTKNVITLIKEPLNSNHRVLEAIETAHMRLQRAITGLYPGHLVLSMDAAIMHHRMVELITAENKVPNAVLAKRQLGDKMCVPYGKILRGFVVPNTVTKSLHTERVYGPEVEAYHLLESPNYSPIDYQLKVIKSFGRKVILVDDLLHRGYRLAGLLPAFKKADLGIDKIIVAVMTARGRDVAVMKEIEVDSPYFFPNLCSWFVESEAYPFFGGDCIDRGVKKMAGLLPTINLVLPYIAPQFLLDKDEGAVYHYSLVCMSNALHIMKTLEEEYQNTFERNLTVNRLGEVLLKPTMPDHGIMMTYNTKLPASVYIENDMEHLVRLRGIVKKI